MKNVELANYGSGYAYYLKISFVCVTVKIFDSECKQIIRSVALKPRDKSSKQGGNGKQVTN